MSDAAENLHEELFIGPDHNGDYILVVDGFQVPYVLARRSVGQETAWDMHLYRVGFPIPTFVYEELEERDMLTWVPLLRRAMMEASRGPDDIFNVKVTKLSPAIPTESEAE